MNKKKIILISSIALILIIAIICVVVFGKDKNSSKANNETTSKVTEVTSTEADTETNSEKETESTTEVESTTEEPTTVEQPTTEAPTEKPVEKPTEKPTETPTTSKTEKPTLSLEEAAKLTPSGSYTEYKFQLGPEYGDALNGYVIVRKTYENGAVRDYLIVDGEECELDSPIGVVPDDYVPNSSNSVGVHTGQQQTQSQNNNKVTYKGIYPARSKYSSDAEWEAAVIEMVKKDGGWRHADYFASEADAKLYAKLCEGTFTGNADFINMTTEEWLKWCEENGFTVN